jgi:hypothetical protein
MGELNVSGIKNNKHLQKKEGKKFLNVSDGERNGYPRHMHARRKRLLALQPVSGSDKNRGRISKRALHELKY